MRARRDAKTHIPNVVNFQIYERRSEGRKDELNYNSQIRLCSDISSSDNTFDYALKRQDILYR